MNPLHFALFGNPVAQSLSPLMHGAAFAKMEFMATYAAYQVDDAAEIVRTIREKGIKGASVTIPFKETVMAFLDEVDANASEIGAVNTIVNRDGKLIGYNTDGPGLIRDLAEWSADPGKNLRHPRRRRSGPGGRLRADSGGRNTHRRQSDGGKDPQAGRPFRLPLGPARGDRPPGGGLPDQHDAAGDVSGHGPDTPEEKVPCPFSSGHGHDLQSRQDSPPAGGQGGRMRRPLRRRDVRSPGGGADPSLDRAGTAAGGHAAGGHGKAGGKWWRLSRSSVWMRRSGSPDRRATPSGRWSSPPSRRENPSSGTSCSPRTRGFWRRRFGAWARISAGTEGT